MSHLPNLRESQFTQALVAPPPPALLRISKIIADHLPWFLKYGCPSYLNRLFEEEKKLIQKVMEEIEKVPVYLRGVYPLNPQCGPLSCLKSYLIGTCSGSVHGPPRLSPNFIGTWRQ
ncbi:hypothetical protein TNCV_872451 [Trichonephila clavipes]|nr:hypothetical protein TNCV_872451 [Trichonephila clavipes]